MTTVTTVGDRAAGETMPGRWVECVSAPIAVAGCATRPVSHAERLVVDGAVAG
jgi:hypothetical protein